MRFLCFVFVLLFSFSAFSQEPLTAPCGMTYDGVGNLVVDSTSGDICEDDITYQMLYLFYENILEHPLWKFVANQFLHEEMQDSEFIEFASNTINISDQTFTIVKGLAAIGYIFLVPIILYKVGKILFNLSKTGELSVGDGDVDAVKLFSYAGFLIFLSLPVGGIMLGQGLSIAGAVPSLYGSNYILAGYLSTTQFGESDVEVSDETLMLGSQVFANTVVGMQVCQNRTVKALFSVNAKKGTSYFYDSNFANFTGLNTDEDDINERVNECLSYHYDDKELGITNAVEEIRLLKKGTSKFSCIGDSYELYEDELYGYQHECGSIKYNYPTNVEEINNWGIEDDLETLQTAFSADKIFGMMKGTYESEVREIIEYRELSPAERKVELEVKYKAFAEEKIIPLLNSNAMLNEPHRERLATKYIFALNAMLGGSNINELSMFGLVKNSLWDEDKDINPVLEAEKKDDNEPHYGFTYIADYARYAADELEQYHCAKNWEDYTELRQFIVEYNFSEDEDTTSLLTNKMHKMECVRFVAEHLNEDSDFSRYIDYTAKWSDDVIFADLDVNQNADTVKVKQLTPEEMIENKETLFELVSQVNYQRALVRKTVLEGYYYAVKYAISQSLSTRMAEEASNDDMYLIARQMGAGNLGGVLMAMSQKQSGGVYYKNLIEDAAVASASGDGSYFVNFDGFGDDSVGAGKADKVRENFNTFDTETFFNIGVAGKADIYQAADVDRESEAYAEFMGEIENLFFEPVIHIKRASGIPDGLTLKQGLDNCLSGNNEQCLSTASHPLVAMSKFGHHLMDNMLTLATVGTITIMVNDAVGITSSGEVGADDEDSKKKKKSKLDSVMSSVKSVVGKVGGGLLVIIFVILAIAAAIFKIIMPFVWSLFVVGAFFSYILPIMGYIYSLSMYILWVVGLSLGALVLPFYIALKFATIEDSYKRGFVEFYETFLNPYIKPLFITIAVIFSWTFASISLFAVNSVFALLYDGLSTLEAGILTTLIFKMLLYMVYFVTIFIMFLTSIKIIKNMPDMMATKMKLRGTNDDQFIESMSFESYVQAGIMRQVASLPQSAADDLRGNIAQKKQDQVLRENLDMMREFIQTANNGAQGAAPQEPSAPKKKGASEAKDTPKSGASENRGEPKSGASEEGND